MLNPSRNMVRPCIRLRRLQVQIECSRGRVIRKVRVHACHFTCVGAHPSGSLARLDVSPDHGGHVALVVHEAGVEVGAFVRVGGLDVRGASGEGVFLFVD